MRIHLSWSLMTVLGSLMTSHPVMAEQTANTVQAIWQPQEITFQYMGFTTAYNCDALADKVERLLRQVGVHESVRASGTGCSLNRPEKSVSVRITLMAPIEASEANRQAIAANENRAALLRRLGVKAADTDAFPAHWQTVTLSDERSASPGSGDCELLEQLQNRVLPKLQVKVVKDSVSCTPHQVSIISPKLTVAALVPDKATS